MLEKFNTNLEITLLIYAFQHPLYMIARVFVFFGTYFLMLMCEAGRDFPENHRFENIAISYDYIAYEEGTNSIQSGG